MADLLNLILIDPNKFEIIFIARLICLNKEGESHGTLDNIRPIAVMSTLLKLIERVLYKYIMQWVDNNDVITKEQVGFMRGCGTELNLLRLRVRADDAKRVS